MRKVTSICMYVCMMSTERHSTHTGRSLHVRQWEWQYMMIDFGHFPRAHKELELWYMRYFWRQAHKI